jgi:hypothetical protein
MPKRILKVTKWLGMTPTVAICAACNAEFKVPVSSLKSTQASRNSLQQQFDTHDCPENASVPQ